MLQQNTNNNSLIKKLSLSKDKIKVLLLENIDSIALEIFKEHGYKNVKLLKGNIESKEAQAEIKDAGIIGIRSRSNLTKDQLNKCKKLFSIGCFCIGTNQVDLNAAAEKAIPVFNAPFSNTRSVAELIIGEIIILARNTMVQNNAAHKGVWLKSAVESNEVRGKTLGIIGYGRIGSQLSILAENLGMNVFYYDIETKLPLGNAKASNSLDDILSRSDFITLHVPATEETKNMIGEREFSLMKKGARFLNASRGNVVDIDALIKFLENKHIRGAAIDVFPVEPKNNQEEFISPLRKFDNVILTPHIGGSTEEGQENIAREVSEKLTKYSDEGSTLTSVNLPNIVLPYNKANTRILQIHKNEHGALQELNSVLSSKGINISAQHLQTGEKIGYVILDIDEDINQDILNEIRSLKTTLRVRIIY